MPLEPHKRIPLHDHADLNSGGRIAGNFLGVRLGLSMSAKPHRGEPARVDSQPCSAFRAAKSSVPWGP
jgi:hypothetical protein